VVIEYQHMAGPTAIFLALMAVHGEDEARSRESHLAEGRAFDLAAPGDGPADQASSSSRK
jgi:hypothetical protein